MADVREREKIARSIEKMSESIRKKHRALKTGRIDDKLRQSKQRIILPHATWEASIEKKLSVYDMCLYMKPITVLFLFKLEQCTEHVYYKLSQCTHGVSEKFKYFVSFLKQNCITSKRDVANTLHKIYDKKILL
ncbi:hypothetical protein ALC56_10568 [Trachymyrmex septentrionalis]|uniref:Uncharacterized protein n=1 Tax=Trachymyrmex septentrionalis TaxID=34720 RepID=A0A195F3R0_9HYME|nr:hypothetical protein ALC56_10568 [Trachymyrmex septentrionalis]